MFGSDVDWFWRLGLCIEGRDVVYIQCIRQLCIRVNKVASDRNKADNQSKGELYDGIVLVEQVDCKNNS